MERACSMTSSYYSLSHAVLLMYDVTEPSSLGSCANWKEEAERYAPPQTVYFLAGNKMDRKHEIEVEKEMIAHFAKRQDIPPENCFRISVKTGQGVEKMFSKIISTLSSTREPAEPKPQRTIADAYDEPDGVKGGGCC